MSVPATLNADTIGNARRFHGHTVSDGVESAIRSASRQTGVDFSYLMEKAAVESGFQADAKAGSSSATGLYQFIDSTWLNVVKEHGGQHGLGELASAIEERVDGTPYVGDPVLRKKILDLRNDPEISALMVGEFTKDNLNHLKQAVGGKIGSTELYLAHFLGAQGASRFLLAQRANPSQPAQDLFPHAANANRAIFYDDKSGRPTTLGEIYDRFSGKFAESDMSSLITGRAQGSGEAFSPASQAGLDPLAGSPISRYATLALAALDLPTDELDGGGDGKTAFGSRRQTADGYRQYQKNEFRRNWMGSADDT